MALSQSVWPVNELGEIVATAVERTAIIEKRISIIKIR